MKSKLNPSANLIYTSNQKRLHYTALRAAQFQHMSLCSSPFRPVFTTSLYTAPLYIKRNPTCTGSTEVLLMIILTDWLWIKEMTISKMELI